MQKAMVKQGRIVSYGGRLAHYDHKLAGIAGNLVTFTKVWGYVSGALTDYQKLKRHDMEAFVPLKFALRFIPILSDFYGRAIDAIPGMKKWFTAFMQQYIRRVDRLSSDTDLKKKRHAPIHPR
ncbi:MAG: hypothetical protein RIK87_14270 [Fuerstiella sp.]